MKGLFKKILERLWKVLSVLKNKTTIKKKFKIFIKYLKKYLIILMMIYVVCFFGWVCWTWFHTMLFQWEFYGLYSPDNYYQGNIWETPGNRFKVKYFWRSFWPLKHCYYGWYPQELTFIPDRKKDLYLELYKINAKHRYLRT